MKKLLTVLIAVILFTGFSNAQKVMYVGAGVVVSLPIGDFGNGANTGFGGTAAFEMKFMPQLVGVGNIGYIVWGTDADNVNFHVVPVMVGVKYYFMPGIGFYGLGQIGLAFFSSSVEIPSYSFGGVSYGGGSASASDTEFSLTIGAGYEVPVSPTFTLDFTGGFNLISSANNIQLRAGGKVAL
jgi:opacity protein-like surface antigen